MQISNKERTDSIIMSGEKCSFGSKSVFDCHCNACFSHIIGYLGKKKGEKYFYNGSFAPQYIRNRDVKILSFFFAEEEEPSSCECFIQLFDGEGGQCEWIPRKEIINNLLEIKNEQYKMGKVNRQI